MNEYSIITHLLSQVSFNPSEIPQIAIDLGCSEETLCNALHFTGKYGKIQLYQLLDQYSRSILPFGLRLKQNPMTKKWFLAKSSEILQFTHTNLFQNKSRLGATLTVIITLVLLNGKPIERQQIQKFRKKQNIDEDLSELESLNFIHCRDSKVHLHPNIGYYLDLPAFLAEVEKRALLKDSDFQANHE